MNIHALLYIHVAISAKPNGGISRWLVLQRAGIARVYCTNVLISIVFLLLNQKTANIKRLHNKKYF